MKINKLKSLFLSLVYLILIFSLGGITYAQLPPPPTGMMWEKVDALSDEFNQGSIDSNKWYDYHPWWTGRLPSQFKQGNAFVSGGYLQLRSTSRIDNMNQVNDPYNDVWVDAAAVVSKQKISEPGWYYEARFKASNTAMSSAFWFRVGSYSEIDVIEHIGNATKAGVDKSYEYSVNTHVYGTQSGSSIGKTYIMPTRGRDEFHTYGFWWKDGQNLWFYHNGVKVMEVTPSVNFGEKLHMIFDTETLSSTWVGLPTIDSLKDNSRNTMLVDWVRTYRLTAGSSTPEPTLAPTPVPTAIPTQTPDAGNKGDVNGDGAIDIVDALLVAQYYVGLNPSGFNAAFADTNCDGSVDIVDALLIAQFYVGLITSLPC